MIRPALALFGAALLASVPLLGKERYGVTAPPAIEVAGKKLQLMGMGLRKKLWFKVYLASLYLEHASEEARKVLADDGVRRVQMHMLRDLERGKIIEAVEQGFEKNAGPKMPALRERLAKFVGAIPDLKEGQELTITYEPGRGTSVVAGGGKEITVEGKDFADALFSVWLGQHPVDDELKEEMLRNR